MGRTKSRDAKLAKFTKLSHLGPWVETMKALTYNNTKRDHGQSFLASTHFVSSAERDRIKMFFLTFVWCGGHFKLGLHVRCASAAGFHWGSSGTKLLSLASHNPLILCSTDIYSNTCKLYFSSNPIFFLNWTITKYYLLHKYNLCNAQFVQCTSTKKGKIRCYIWTNSTLSLRNFVFVGDVLWETFMLKLLRWHDHQK